MMAGAPTSRPAPDASRAVIQLLPAGQGGVADFAGELQRAWQAQGRPVTALRLRDADLAGRSLEAMAQDGLGDLGLPASTPVALLLHFSGYGFHPRGLCLRLAAAAEALAARSGQRPRLVTYCHELFASGPPWRSAFWLSPLQASLARRVVRASDAVTTNAAAHAGWMQRARGGVDAVPVWPVFSCVGEPDEPLGARPGLWAGRRPIGLVFGAASTRRRVATLLHGRASKVRLLQDWGVDSLLEVGSGSSQLDSGPPGLTSRFLGRLEPTALQDLLLACRFGLLEYPDALLGKSSVLAAYAAHGLTVVNLAPRGPAPDGLVAGEHFIGLDAAAAGPPAREAAAARIAQAARHWYAGHRRETVAAALARLCEGHPVRPEDTRHPSLVPAPTTRLPWPVRR